MKKEIYAKKHFGQNFLNDQNVLNKIINVFDFTNCNVLEIGPGRGALTKKLVEKAKNVLCYEIDLDMVKILEKEFLNQENIQIIHQDFLEANLTNLPKSYLIANIPYYITTDILFKIFDHKDKFDGVLLMVQKEVAQRMAAAKNTSEYSKLSVSCQYLAQTKLEFVVKASSFNPAPKVDSAIISLKFHDNISIEDWKLIKDFFKLVFSNRRKKLSFALSSYYSKNQIQQAYQNLNLPENIRIQQLDIKQIVDLFEQLKM
ncbi:16S rRNA (adenine(1518)-N(6)/adenine(1519)-N(6))-dimethyltransferase RsmA [Mycoplasmopsis sturni]|uniref:16S rRNA (adenine(1518)-N(6)/adenine(1519)-N(6))- dimethyltransferase RsmA n=1 Tax=Mycoplasmopsis sturni TaxID=39047 RepID=UPI000561CCD0|nr:16S rRNA (adenine(1518)-N(6)/adenine(1519)-N(6))-dimethyltransferase RsmA [Mycoplasmopsis sturni]